jgi:hypothetical protein
VDLNTCFPLKISINYYHDSKTNINIFFHHKGEVKMENLLILGGGYGGMKFLNEVLPAHLPENVKITLVDRVPYHCLKTEYYALAAGTISDKDVRVAFPEHPRLEINMGKLPK